MLSGAIPSEKAGHWFRGGALAFPFREREVGVVVLDDGCWSLTEEKLPLFSPRGPEPREEAGGTEALPFRVGFEEDDGPLEDGGRAGGAPEPLPFRSPLEEKPPDEGGRAGGGGPELLLPLRKLFDDERGRAGGGLMTRAWGTGLGPRAEEEVLAAAAEVEARFARDGRRPGKTPEEGGGEGVWR